MSKGLTVGDLMLMVGVASMVILGLGLFADDLLDDFGKSTGLESLNRSSDFSDDVGEAKDAFAKITETSGVVGVVIQSIKGTVSFLKLVFTSITVTLPSMIADFLGLGVLDQVIPAWATNIILLSVTVIVIFKVASAAIKWGLQ